MDPKEVDQMAADATQSLDCQEEKCDVTQPLLIKDVTAKSLGNTDTNTAKSNVKDIVFWGDGDTFKLISKASSEVEGWMKSTKAMQVGKLGCVIQVTTQQGDNIAEALTYVPGARIVETKDKAGKVISRSFK